MKFCVSPCTSATQKSQHSVQIVLFLKNSWSMQRKEKHDCKATLKASVKKRGFFPERICGN